MYFTCLCNENRTVQFLLRHHLCDKQYGLHRLFYGSSKKRGHRLNVLVFRYLHICFGQYLLKVARYVLRFSYLALFSIQNLPMLRLSML